MFYPSRKKSRLGAVRPASSDKRPQERRCRHNWSRHPMHSRTDILLALLKNHEDHPAFLEDRVREKRQLSHRPDIRSKCHNNWR